MWRLDRIMGTPQAEADASRLASDPDAELLGPLEAGSADRHGNMFGLQDF